MSNNFCRYLSNGYSFIVNQLDNSIGVRPCCWFRGSIRLDDQVELNRARYNAINSWIPECTQCQILEKSGQQSLRQSAFDWIGNVNHTRPISVDITFDKTCNAACVICDDVSSTLWYKEKQKLINESFVIKTDVADIDDKIDKIAQAFDYTDLRYVKFFGGEPLFTDTHLKFLKTIPNPKNVTVHYTTNGSIFPSAGTLEQWSHFKTIIFAASLDGTDQQFDYVRWPLPWHKVSDNLLRLRAQKVHNIMFRVEFTVNFLNAWYFDRLQQWVNDNWATNEFGDPTELNVHHCVGVFDPQCMPENLRKETMQKYPPGHVIHRMISGLAEPMSLTPFNEFTNTWDQRRKQNWRQSFSEIEHLFPF
jgi:sulfatase maturation enzyme AslB (radical SAM superfamily)